MKNPPSTLFFKQRFIFYPKDFDRKEYILSTKIGKEKATLISYKEKKHYAVVCNIIQLHSHEGTQKKLLVRKKGNQSLDARPSSFPTMGQVPMPGRGPHTDPHHNNKQIRWQFLVKSLKPTQTVKNDRETHEWKSLLCIDLNLWQKKSCNRLIMLKATFHRTSNFSHQKHTDLFSFNLRHSFLWQRTESAISKSLKYEQLRKICQVQYSFSVSMLEFYYYSLKDLQKHLSSMCQKKKQI